MKIEQGSRYIAQLEQGSVADDDDDCLRRVNFSNVIFCKSSFSSSAARISLQIVAFSITHTKINCCLLCTHEHHFQIVTSKLCVFANHCVQQCEPLRKASLWSENHRFPSRGVNDTCESNPRIFHIGALKMTSNHNPCPIKSPNILQHRKFTVSFEVAYIFQESSIVSSCQSPAPVQSSDRFSCQHFVVFEFTDLF